MKMLGWQELHNRHMVVEKGGDRLVIAGVDDYTAKHSGTGHRADHEVALEGADPALPVLLLAHQPKQIGQAVEHGIDLQISGHTHGGQIWPFNYLVMLDQPSVAGLSKHGERPSFIRAVAPVSGARRFGCFAPSEITLITLRSA